jgi:hypothetical protein
MPGGDVLCHRIAQRLRAVEIWETLGQVQRAGFGSELRHAGEDGGAYGGEFAREHSAGSGHLAKDQAATPCVTSGRRSIRGGRP